MDRLAEVRQRFTVLDAVLDEKSRRLLVARKAKRGVPVASLRYRKPLGYPAR
jgi:hypothetical protein